MTAATYKLIQAMRLRGCTVCFSGVRTTVPDCRRQAYSSTSSPTDGKHYDVLIIGGGVVGSALAKILLHSSSHTLARIGLLETKRPHSSFFYDLRNCIGPERQHPMARAYALSPFSLSLLGPNILAKLEGRVGYYDKMQIWESDGPATLRFTSDDIADFDVCEGAPQGVLGAVAEDGPLVSALWEELESHNENDKQVDLISPAIVKSIVAPPVDSSTSGSSLVPLPPVELSYEDPSTLQTKTITTSLLVGADGGNSYTRRALSIPTMGFGYERKAITCTVQLSESMRATAYQRFLRGGPIALLPIWSEGGDEKYANVVWSSTPERASQLQSLPAEEFVSELNDQIRVGPVNNPPLFPLDAVARLPTPLSNVTYGIERLASAVNGGLTMSAWAEKHPFQMPPLVSAILGKRYVFPLNLTQCSSYAKGRVALVGDAAHTVHPMAGQGLNLGLGDASSLSSYILKASNAGMDVSTFLSQYDAKRRMEVGVMMGAIHALHEAFDLKAGPAVFARSLGMNLVNSVQFVRGGLAGVATGVWR